MAKAITPPPPALQEATKNSTAHWQHDLESLFLHAKDRFPDVVWDLIGEDDQRGKDPEEVWGHKAIVYARAPPSFQARYFSFRPAPIASPLPYSPSPTGTIQAQSALSLSLALDLPGASRSSSPYHRIASPTPSTTPGGLLRLATSINPTLFSNELEYLYTGKGFGEAFEFLFDTSESREEGDAEENRIDKLRKDLVFMWRSRLYSDIRIALTGNFNSANHENTTAIFSSHRFILVSRTSYFHDALISWGTPKSDEPLEITLPSPPFTPASLHFTLGFIYTGTLVFSHRTYDLDTSFHIMRSASYINLQSLYNEVQARIVQEMAHGLFHAFIEFTEYERITGGKWGIGGCRCRQCARRVPRILEFAIAPDVKNPYLDRGAKRALVGIFGEGWCTPEFVSLDPKIREGIVKGVGKRTTPGNVFALLFAANKALGKLGSVVDAWAEIVREDVRRVRKGIDECLCGRIEECFGEGLGGGEEWEDIMQSGGIRFEDEERVEWVMEAVKRGLGEKNAGIVYQTIVSAILLRPHVTDTDATMLANTSPVRIKVEACRMDILKWIKKRWVGIRHEGAFDTLEGWALKEISHEIEVPVEDLVSPDPNTLRGPPTKTGLRPSLIVGDQESETVSLRASVLSRNVNRNITPTASSAASVHSVARSTLSTASKVTPVRRNQPPPGPRPDSKLTPSSSSSVSTLDGRKTPAINGRKTPGISKPTPMPSTRRIASGMSTPTNDRPVSSTPSLAASVKSQASTIRKTSGPSKPPPPPSKTSPSASPSTLRPPTSASKRPISTASTRRTSTASDASTAFKTASDRRSSAASNISIKTTGTTSKPPVPLTKTSTAAAGKAAATTTVPRSRRTSDASVISTTSTSAKVTPRRPPLVSEADGNKLSPPEAAKRSPSMSSIKSTASTASTAATKKPVVTVKKVPEKPPPVPSKTTSKVNGGPAPASAVSTLKGKTRAETLASESSDVSSGSASTVKVVLKRKGSADTITRSTDEMSGLRDPLPMSPHGATLEIGIPCIISSKRKRFKAFARYIGEVQGESGPWVGVEVPMGDSWSMDSKPEGPQWNDGTWGGIRYFEIGSGGSEWDYGDERATRRRRVDWVNNIGKTKGLKRQGDQLSVGRAKRLRSSSPATSDASNPESRGLFVRPQQVLYVVDAVGADL